LIHICDRLEERLNFRPLTPTETIAQLQGEIANIRAELAVANGQVRYSMKDQAAKFVPANKQQGSGSYQGEWEMIGNGTHRLISLDLLGAIAGALSRSKNAPKTLEKVRSLIELDGDIQLRADRARSRFDAWIGDSPNAPYPGMIKAFESHYGQSFADKDWRNEASVWAAAWKAAEISRR
jgi:hypothetical protein